MGISPTGNDVALAATLARAIQEVDTDLLNGLNHLDPHVAGSRLAFVPILAEKQGSGPEASDIEGSGGADHRGSCSLVLRWLCHAQTGMYSVRHALALGAMGSAADLGSAVHARARNGSSDCQTPSEIIHGICCMHLHACFMSAC